MSTNKNILVAPLNWGLGHATRCIPIIRALEETGYNPIIASDGVAFQLLKKEFPNLLFLELPSYEIEYAKKGIWFKWKLIKNSPKMMEAIIGERKLVKKWVKEHNIMGIISDNRLGVYSKKVPSVFITHQINVLTGNTTWLSSKIHQYIIKKYTECWVPDVEHTPNLTGRLGHIEGSQFKINYIGPLSRFSKKVIETDIDLLVVLSGPEPQRTFLDELLTTELKNYEGKIWFVKGVVETEQKVFTENNITFYNFMTSNELEDAFNRSKRVLSRSGYTTVMDLAALGKKAFFIPTPGQYEQEYLAKKYKKEGLVPYSKQEKFMLKNLYEIDFYKGLDGFYKEKNWNQLFLLFESK